MKLMQKKVLALALAAAVAGGVVFAQAEMDHAFIVSGFEVVPSFGLLLPVEIEQGFGTVTFAAEARAGISFGSAASGYGTDGTSFVIEPGLVGLANYYLPKTVPEAVQKLSAHFGVGFSVPVAIVSETVLRNNEPYSATGVGFRFDLLMGLQYDFTRQISALIDWNLGLGGLGTSAFRAGVIWRF